jgi:hypothetical protein
MVLLGVDPGYHSVPLHRINSKLDFAEGEMQRFSVFDCIALLYKDT